MHIIHSLEKKFSKNDMMVLVVLDIRFIF